MESDSVFDTPPNYRGFLGILWDGRLDAQPEVKPRQRVIFS
jgi:hypothetical protein